MRSQDLPHSICMNKIVVMHAIRSHHSTWKDIPFEFKSDPTIIATAFLYMKIEFEDIPTDLQRSNREIAIHGIVSNLIQADECTCFGREDFAVAIQDGRLEWKHLP